MNPRLKRWLTVAVTLLIADCSREYRFGRCIFERPDKLINLKTREPRPLLLIARKNADRNALLFLTDPDDEHRRIGAIRIDLRTGLQSADSMTYDADGRTPSAGYVQFKSAYSSHPLFATNTIRFAYTGRTGKIWYPERSIDGRWSIESDERFTGTRRIMFGNRVLVNQAVTNFTPKMPVDWYVAIEPDGDRVVCLCEDTDVWLGIFSRKKLESAQGSRK